MFILGSPIVTQAVVSIPAAAETISTSEIEEATLSTSENLSEQQVAEPAVTEETTTSETSSKEKAAEQETVETTKVEETESDQRTEQSAENVSTEEAANIEEDTESSMASDESQEVKSALAENILWTGMWGTAPATLDLEGVLTVGAGTLSTTVDQVIPLDDSLKNMVIKKVVLTAPVILPANVPGLFESTYHYGKVPSELDEIVGLTYLDTSQATTMNSMFYGFRGTTLDLSNFDSSGVISYVYEDSKEAAPDKTDTVTFTRTVTTNEATGENTYGEWQAKDDDTTFDEVQSPEIKNYHADKSSIEEVTGLTAEDKDREVTITYSPNMVESTETKEIKQTIHYMYEDGKEAVPDKVDTVTFTRTVTTNEATGDKTFGQWQAKDDDTTFLLR